MGSAATTAAWFASVEAARIRVKHKHGLIMHVTDNWHDHPLDYRGQILWDLGHEYLNRLILATGHEHRWVESGPGSGTDT